MKIKVAAIQLENCFGDTKRSFYEAEQLIREAHKAGATMMFLPELSSCGYIPNQNVWLHAELLYGPTTKWATLLSEQLHIYIGAGFCECDGYDFYNSYLIANPEGQIDGVVRKLLPESYCFRPSGLSSVIDTKIGRIGIGICADSHYTWFLKRLQKELPQLIVLPHAIMTPIKQLAIISKDDQVKANVVLSDLPKIYAKTFEASVVFINQIGTFPTMQGILGRFMNPKQFQLCGLSSITTADGGMVQAGDKPSFIIQEVDIENPTMEHQDSYKNYGGWLHPGSFIVRKFIIPYDIMRGERFYRHSKKRRSIATMFFKMMHQ